MVYLLVCLHVCLFLFVCLFACFCFPLFVFACLLACFSVSVEFRVLSIRGVKMDTATVKTIRIVGIL